MEKKSARGGPFSQKRSVKHSKKHSIEEKNLRSIKLQQLTDSRRLAGSSMDGFYDNESVKYIVSKQGLNRSQYRQSIAMP